MVYPTVAILVGDMNGCVMWRALQPAAALVKRGYPVTVSMMGTNEAIMNAAEADILMIPRALFTRPQAERKWFEWALKTKTVIYEADDDIWSATPWLNPTMEGEKLRDYPLTVHRAGRAAKRCDGIIVTGKVLAARALTVAPNAVVEIVPNMIDLEWWRSIVPLAVRHDPDLTVGWIGGQRNDHDIDVMLEAWKILAAKYPTLKFLAGDHNVERIREALPADRYRFLPNVPFYEYPAIYRQVDIGCAPVADTAFNMCKSPIKVMEYAAGGAPCVASRTLYGDWFSPEDGVGFAVTVEDWVREISSLVENKGLRDERHARTMRAVEARFDLAKGCYKWIDAWCSIWETGKARIRRQGVQRDARNLQQLLVRRRGRGPEISVP